MAFVGFLCAFGGKWFGGYAKNSKGDNYADRGSRVLVKEASSMDGVNLFSMDYRKVFIPDNSIIYCDPPYKGTTGYTGVAPFDNTQFIEWCLDKADEGHEVWVSEYDVEHPRFLKMWEKEVSTKLDKNISKSRTEKLYVVI